jgi:HK97 gp10 family phage protein
MAGLQEASYRELSTLLKSMTGALRGQALKTAARDAMKPALEQAREGAPVADPPYGPYTYNGYARLYDPYPRKTYKGQLVTPGFGKRSIRMVAALYDDMMRVRVAIGMRREAFYLAFVELGTSKMAKHPWLEPSFRYSVGEVERVFIKRLKELLEKAAAKGGYNPP